MALTEALNGIVRRHEALRTVFEERDGEPWQVVQPFVPLQLEHHDFNRMALPGAEAELTLLIDRQRTTAIDLARGPMLRAHLVQLAPQNHALIVILHHIVFDGWSIGVFSDELARGYDAALRATTPVLPALPLQYAEFAARQHGQLADGALAKQLTYWHSALRDIAPLELPFDHALPGADDQPGRGRLTCTVQIASDLVDVLGTLGREVGATPFMVLLAAFQALLHRVTGSARVQVGVPIAGRNRRETEPLIGFFVNILVLVVDCGCRPTFRGLIERARDAALAAYAHQDLPFERLVEELRPERALGRNPLFNVSFALQQPPALPQFGHGLVATSLSCEVGARFDLELYLWRKGGGLAGVIMADERLFTPATVEGLRHRFEILLAGAAAHPDRPIADLPFLSAAELEKLSAWNATSRSYPLLAVADLFAEQAEATPEAVAVLDGDGFALTFAGLRARARQLARRLLELGVGPGAIVAVVFEDRSADLVTAFLAVLEAGAAYLPLDPAQPPARLALMLEDAGVVLAIADAASAGQLPEGLPCLLPGLAEERAGIDALPGTALSLAERGRRLMPDDLAYACYSSGSTGTPKGILITHRAIARLAKGQCYLALGPGDRVAHAAAPAFDATTFELWGALLNGAAVVVVPRAVLLEPARLFGLLQAQRVTALFLTTALFNRLVDHDPGGFGGLAALLFGGEACDPARVRRVLEAGGPGRLLHVYGPTESTTFASFHEVAAVAAGAVTVPIGRPLANTRLHVLDGQGRPVPPGGTGELCIGGPGLARGYLGSPALTAARFVPDGVSGLAGERLYRTGDRVRLRAAGALEFLGRLDRQVKIRGYRIEPGEIEACLRQHPAVQDAAVIVEEPAQHNTPTGDQRKIVAYVVAGSGEIEAEELREYARRLLPDHMCPRHISVLSAWPLNANGKLDRAALPKLDLAGGRRCSGPLQSPIEADLAVMLAELLGLPAVGRQDDFFELGGHSLAAMKLISRLRTAFGIELPLELVFEASTVAGLAEVVQARLTASPEQAPPPITRRATTVAAPASFAQRRLWFIEQVGHAGAAYHSPVSVKLRGRLDVGALEQSLTMLVERHDALRTVFADREGEPCQNILPPTPLRPRLIDLSGLPKAERGAGLRTAIEEESTRQFNLARDFPIRVLLVRCAPSEHVLTIVFHHIAFDGWSLPVVARELSHLYAAALDGKVAGLPPLPVQYADFTFWQRDRLAGPALGELLSYWRQRLADVPELCLPTDRPRPEVETFLGQVHRFAWATGVGSAVMAFARDRRTTPFIVLLAAFKVLLHRYTGLDRILVGSPIANRTRREIEGLIGFFVNSLALATDLSGDPSFAIALARVRETALGAYAHQDLPFERLVEELRPQRDLGRNPLFQVMFALQQPDAMAPAFRLPGLEAELMELGDVAVRFDLEVHLWFEDRTVHGYLFFNRDLFDPGTIARLEGHFHNLLKASISTPDLQISALPLLTPEELRQLEEWDSACASV